MYKNLFTVLGIALGIIGIVCIAYCSYCITCFKGECLHVQETWCDPIAFQFSVMNTILVCVTIILATMAFIGFNTLKTHADILQRKLLDSYLRELKHREVAKEREENKNPYPLEQAVKENQIKPEENI